MTSHISHPLPLNGNNRLTADEAWMHQAIGLAQQAEKVGEVPVGAIVVQASNVIGRGFNQPIRTHDPSQHAEVVAIRAAAHYLKNYRLNNTTLYVTLEPCAMCAGLIQHARIGRVVFGAWDPKGGGAGSLHNILNHPKRLHHAEVVGGVLEAQCRQQLQTFFQARRKNAHSV